MEYINLLPITSDTSYFTKAKFRNP